MIKMTFYWERICEYEPKNNSVSLELFSFFKQLAGLIEEHLDLGPILPRIDRFFDAINHVETFRC